MQKGSEAPEMWLNVTWWHVRPSCPQNSFSIEDALDACERELGPLVGCAADVAGERTPLFKQSSREPNDKTSQTTYLGRKEITQPNPDAGERKASTPDTTLINWSIPVRLPSGTPMETWTNIPTSRGTVKTRSRFASKPFESRSEVAQLAQLESTDFLTPFRRSVYRLCQPPLRALKNATSLVPFLMLPFGFWVAFGLLVTWRDEWSSQAYWACLISLLALFAMTVVVSIRHRQKLRDNASADNLA